MPILLCTGTFFNMLIQTYLMLSLIVFFMVFEGLARSTE